MCILVLLVVDDDIGGGDFWVAIVQRRTVCVPNAGSGNANIAHACSTNDIQTHKKQNTRIL